MKDVSPPSDRPWSFFLDDDDAEDEGEGSELEGGDSFRVGEDRAGRNGWARPVRGIVTWVCACVCVYAEEVVDAVR